MRLYTFHFKEEKKFNEFKRLVMKYTNPNAPEDTTSFAKEYAVNIKKSNVWLHRYEKDDGCRNVLIDEYERMGISLGIVSMSPWRISSANDGFSLCSSYPAYLCVPSNVSDNILSDSALFRAQGRFPVLTWKSKTSDAAIIRCSQPYVGPSGSRCNMDEVIFEEIVNANKSSKTLYILDCRSKTAAVGNLAAGGGYEFEGNYKDCKIEFMGIENIHAVRESYINLFRLINSDDMTHWLSKLEDTSWLKHISTILQATSRVVDLIHETKASVVVHCSDGWDRTTQVCSLAQICLDPYYRTLDGFTSLIKKEWCHFGHKFFDRCFDGSERSPIFLQFIDCVHQLIMQYPTEFEFNESLLLDLVDAVHECRFGTFLFNSQKQRLYNSVDKDTISVWQYINEFKAAYINIYYEYKIQVLKPIYYERRMRFFEEFFWRYDTRMVMTRQKQTLDMVFHKKILAIESKLEALDDDENTSSMDIIEYIKSAFHSLKPSTTTTEIISKNYLNAEPMEPYESLNSENLPQLSSTILAVADMESFKFNRPIWVPDGAYNHCKACSKKMYIGNRHHCRNCGHLFCTECANFKAKIPDLGYFKQVRVCRSCKSTFNQKL